jgi:hypothetical protein
MQHGARRMEDGGEEASFMSIEHRVGLFHEHRGESRPLSSEERRPVS